MSQKLHYDLCVIGAGLNGTSIARDAAGRGLSVLLVEAEDLAGATSSATSKLLLGGVPGLDDKTFSANIRSLKECEILYKNAQHVIRPITCVMPLDQNDETGRWADLLWRAKLWLHNFLSERDLLLRSQLCVLEGKDEKLSALKNPVLAEVEEDISIMKPHERLRVLGNITEKDYAHRLARKTLVFVGCKVDDTRLVVCNAVDAALRGANVLTYTTCVGLQGRDGCWRVSLRDTHGDDTINVTASMVVNATGPWVCDFVKKMGVGKSDPDLPKVKLAKDSHIILPRQYEGEHAYVLRQEDGRTIYVMPYEGDYTLVGASHEDYEGDADPREARISDDETRTLIEAYNAAFEKPVTQSDVVFSFSAVHPVYIECAAEGKRYDYYIYHHKRRDIPLISVYGGKMEHYRMLAQDVVDRLMALSGRMVGGWTAFEPLVSAKFWEEAPDEVWEPGFGYQKSLEAYMVRQKQAYPWLPESLLERYIYAYGTQMEEIVGDARSLEGLGEHYGDGVYEAELNYLKEREWVFGAEDMLWRRSKLALHITGETEARINKAFLPEEEETLLGEKSALCA